MNRRTFLAALSALPALPIATASGAVAGTEPDLSTEVVQTWTRELVHDAHDQYILAELLAMPCTAITIMWQGVGQTLQPIVRRHTNKLRPELGDSARVALNKVVLTKLAGA